MNSYSIRGVKVQFTFPYTACLCGQEALEQSATSAWLQACQQDVQFFRPPATVYSEYNALNSMKCTQLRMHETCLFCPGSLDQLRIEHLLPAMKALNISPVFKVLSCKT